MKAVVLKPIMWSTNNYIKPSGNPGSSGYPAEYGFGHEEWNNKDNRIWRGFKLFHTESTDNLNKFSKNGELGILMIASHKAKQYVVGIATNVYRNDKSERELIARELNLYQEWKEVWALSIVKEKFDKDNNKFMQHWNDHYEWIQWRCPRDQYHSFSDPIPINPKKISGKTRLTTMYGRFQVIYPEQAILLIKNKIDKNHPIISWLSEPDFDEEMISKDIKIFFQDNKSKFPTRKIVSGSNSPSERKYRYWVEGERSVTLIIQCFKPSLSDFSKIMEFNSKKMKNTSMLNTKLMVGIYFRKSNQPLMLKRNMQFDAQLGNSLNTDINHKKMFYLRLLLEVNQKMKKWNLSNHLTN